MKEFVWKAYMWWFDIRGQHIDTHSSAYRSMRRWFDGPLSGYPTFVTYYLPPILFVLFLLFVILLIAAFRIRAKRERAYIHRQMSGKKSQTLRVGTGTGGAPVHAFEPDIAGPLADVAAVQEAIRSGERQGRIAVDILRQKTEQVEKMAYLAKRQIDSTMALSDSVYRAQMMNESRRMEQIRAQYEVAEMKAKLEALEAIKEAAIHAAGRPALNLGSGGFTAHVSDDEITRRATDILVEVRKARDGGKDAGPVINAEVSKLQQRYDSLTVGEILKKFQAYQSRI